MRIAATALLFAGLHVPEYWGARNHVLLIMVVTLALSLARGLSGSLAPSVVLHLSCNLSLMIALFFASGHFHTIQSFAFFCKSQGGEPGVMPGSPVVHLVRCCYG